MKNSKKMANGVAAFRAKAAFLGIKGYETMNKRQIKARLQELGGWGTAVQGRHEEWMKYWSYLKAVSRAKSKLPPKPQL